MHGGEKVFLAKRAETKKFLSGAYELPGGHIEYGEDMVHGLQREIFEEFQMKIKVGDPFAAFTYTNEIKGSHSIEVIYFAQFEGSLADIKIHPNHHSEFGWFAEDELNRVISQNKNEDDPEIQAMKKGFSLLKGKALKF